MNVKIPLLRGHGTSVKDLDSLEYEDFLSQVEEELKKDMKRGKEVILGGISFGGQIALYLAAHYPVQGIFAVCVPYKLKFPFSVPKIEKIGSSKKYWKKIIPGNVKKLRKNAFHYPYMHIKGLEITRKANREVAKCLEKITCPVLIVHAKKDLVAHSKSARLIEKGLKNTLAKKVLIDNRNHNIFFTEKRQDAYDSIGDFFERPRTGKKEKVAAIVPAYNEAKKISAVLGALTKTSMIDEIIVVDDGSTDNTADVARAFTSIRLLKNKRNIGKASSIQRGIEQTDASVLFFCDADLVGITPKIIEQIIKPVITGSYDMFIGTRNNILQKIVPLFAINSGERALRRDLWDRVPKRFKNRYRMEVGLNYIAKKYGKGYGYKKFNYYQTVKEKKYGLIRGSLLRWSMNLDIAAAYGLVLSSFLWRGLLKKREEISANN